MEKGKKRQKQMMYVGIEVDVAGGIYDRLQKRKHGWH